MIRSTPTSQRRKRACHLRPRKTRFVELLRSTPHQTVCSDFYVLAHADGCTFSPQCSYCYLKSSLWYQDRPQAFSNVDTLVKQVAEWIEREELETYVLNAGNLSDSLSFEDARPLVERLVRLFREAAEAKGRPHTLLLVTKGGLAECAPLLCLSPCRNVVVSFSVNAADAAQRHEPGTAPPDERLAAAEALKKAGWRVRIRIDPMIHGFDYAELGHRVAQLAPERVTLGTLRAEHNLDRMAKQPLFDGLDRPANKKALARYPLTERLALYRQVTRVLGDVCPIGLCEETPDAFEALGLTSDANSCNCQA